MLDIPWVNPETLICTLPKGSIYQFTLYQTLVTNYPWDKGQALPHCRVANGGSASPSVCAPHTVSQPLT